MLAIIAYVISALALTYACWRLWKLRRRPSTANRGLFRFSDGVRVREKDPIAILIALESHGKFRFDIHPSRAQDGEAEAYDIIADAVRQAFGVPAYSEPGKPGLTVRECFELLCAFLDYVESQKKSTKSAPTSAESTDVTPNVSEPPTTQPTSDSGSTESEPAPSRL